MMGWRASVLAPLLALLLLAGCKVDLYGGLSEEEANQMAALLMSNKIAASKTLSKGGAVDLKVEQAQFVDAVEVLRQNGLPKRKYDTMPSLFPAGQLVVSPTQEQAKMSYLKEQQLEKMLAGLDGVITAQVSIASTAAADGVNRGESRSAAIMIKYNPEFNLAGLEQEIRGLVRDGIPNLEDKNISVLLQAASLRYRPTTAMAQTVAEDGVTPGRPLGLYRMGAAVLAGVMLVGGLIWFLLRRRSVRVNTEQRL